MFELYIRVRGTLRFVGEFATYGEALRQSRLVCDLTPGHEGWTIFEP